MRASVQFELRFLGVSHSELNRGKLADDAELEESLCGNALLSFLPHVSITFFCVLGS